MMHQPSEMVTRDEGKLRCRASELAQASHIFNASQRGTAGS